ncbi:MAG: hypothetical protein IIB57_00450 [Planctomycetes bacterium]|nr:hypothetical protein [Planctomycetota bacterium]
MSATIVEPATNVDSAVRLELRRLRDATGRISGSIFYGTMLRTMRESVLKGEHGHGGRGEEIFAAQLHGILAERMGASGQNPLAESLYRHLERQQAGIIRARLHGKGSTE